MTRPHGMHPSAWSAYLQACFDAKIGPNRCVQTIGNAKASKGTHAQDGTFPNGTIHGEPYCAALDLSVRGLTEAQVRTWLECLAQNGFAGWYRYTGSFKASKHIHCIFVGLRMKALLRRQVVDFLADRNGLVNHGKEQFYTAPAEVDSKLRALFERANP
jgi:hypothetical protein